MVDASRKQGGLFFRDYEQETSLSEALYGAMRKGLKEYAVTLASGKRISSGPLNVKINGDPVKAFINELTEAEQKECLQSLNYSQELVRKNEKDSYFVVILSSHEQSANVFGKVQTEEKTEMFIIRASPLFEQNADDKHKQKIKETGILHHEDFRNTNIADYYYRDYNLTSQIAPTRRYYVDQSLTRETSKGFVRLTVKDVVIVFPNFKDKVCGFTYGQIKYMRECKDSYHRLLMRMEDCVTITSTADNTIRKLKIR